MSGEVGYNLYHSEQGMMRALYGLYPNNTVRDRRNQVELYVGPR